MKKILVAMSGGVDSSSTALMLKNSGYEVIGCFLNMHTNNQQAIQDAKLVSEFIGIELIIKDISQKFLEIVKDDFYKEYRNGRTPNPCVLCNKEIKFKELFSIADGKDIKLVATGHYANRIYDEKNKKYILKKSKNLTKDQTYMLWRLGQNELERIIFPLGEYTNKSDVRIYAEDQKLPVFDKKDSQDICFIPSNDYHDFIKEYSASINDIILDGDVIINGKSIGKHKGIPYYTIGQRRGLGIAYKEPIYVKQIDVENNIIEVATLENTYSKGLIAADYNIINDEKLKEGVYNIKIRYKSKEKLGTISEQNGRLIVNFNEPISSIALGQSVVLYDDDVLIGGGIISEVF
ncbi:MAG: tRNA 2-thiouridine(34) synthase MnmA [Bacteroidetes bacterium]|nr:tRNA 2-thiouridine(34) synthase MnmA [Bacteroidota bacterium]